MEFNLMTMRKEKMKRELSIAEKKYAQKIKELRSTGMTEEALKMCNDAIYQYSDNNFFYKIKGDILLSLSEYPQAMDCYMDYLDKIKNSPQYFTNFSKFMDRLKGFYEVNEEICKKLLDISRDRVYADVIRKGVFKILCDCWKPSDDVKKILEQFNLDYSWDAFEKAISVLKEKNECDKIFFFNGIKSFHCIKKNNTLNRKILKMLEDMQMFEKAIEWINAMLEYTQDGVVVRSLFRNCRMLNDYSYAIEYIGKRGQTGENDFNVLYELVLFYDSQGDETARTNTLEKIKNSYTDSIPISQTLFKFYMSYDMLEDARIMQERINDLKNKKQAYKNTQKIYDKAVQENQNIIWERLEGLLKEQEHNRQLLAITELIKGFAHELGQPLTNIRYAIQLFCMRKKKDNQMIDTDAQELFDGILLQTQRVGKLLSRFAPIVSSRNFKEYFNVYDEVCSIFDELRSRLHNDNIVYRIEGDQKLVLYGEKIQFSQIFYNLIINSIYAINKKKIKGRITVDIQKENDCVIIKFYDNGTGIPKENQRKIFNPFFSTKKKEIEEGGEGLGLYIVWNILKMYNGTISVDGEYKNGAMFIMKIKVEEESDV